MDQMTKDLKTVAKDLKKLTQKTEKMVNRLKKLEKAQTAKKPKAKTAKKAVVKKPTRVFADGTVLALIIKSKKGVDTVALRKKTGFQGRKIGDIIYRLKKQGKIKGLGKGLYVKA